MKKTKFILTLSNDKIPIIAEVRGKRIVEKDERVIGRDCLQANLDSKRFIDITKQASYKGGRLYAHADSI